MNNKLNYCVIMAGGIGNRFWPVSTMQQPKQFLDFFGIGKSLLQMTVDRFKGVIPTENILVVTNVLYRDVVMQQLPEFKSDQILLEPSRRNTAPCIAYAMTHIKRLAFSRMGRDENVRVVVAPSDHLILQEEKFHHVIEEGLDFVADHDSLLTVGIQPTRPEVEYGYIQMIVSDEKIKRVKTFTEKPSLDLAKVFMASGEFLWNSGMYMWNIHTILNELNRFMPDMMGLFAQSDKHMCTEGEEAYIQQIFPACPNISIDYGVMEKAQNVQVMLADFDWSDLGTWGAVYDASKKDEQGNVTLHGDATYSDSTGNIVCLRTGYTALIRGLSHYIVAQNDNVIMICPKWEEGVIDKEKASVKIKNKV